MARRDQLTATLRTIPPDVSDRLAQADHSLAAARQAAAHPGASRGAIERLQMVEQQHNQLRERAHTRLQWLDRHGRAIGEYQDIAGEWPPDTTDG